MKKKHRRMAAYGLIALAVVLAIILIPKYVKESQPLTALTSDTTAQELEFCQTEQECLNVMAAAGLPSDYLEKNEIKVTCQNGRCFATQ